MPLVLLDVDNPEAQKRILFGNPYTRLSTAPCSINRVQYSRSSGYSGTLELVCGCSGCRELTSLSSARHTDGFQVVNWSMSVFVYTCCLRSQPQSSENTRESCGDMISYNKNGSHLPSLLKVTAPHASGDNWGLLFYSVQSRPQLGCPEQIRRSRQSKRGRRAPQSLSRFSSSTFTNDAGGRLGHHLARLILSMFSPALLVTQVRPY